MAKKYYWLKLPETFFRQKEVRGLRRMDNGADLVIIYQKIMLDSIGCAGRIIFERYAPTLEEEVADNIGEDTDLVKTVLDFMKDHNLIVEVSDDEYELPSVVSLIGCETEDAIRKRLAKSKKESERTNSGQIPENFRTMSGQCHTDIEIEKDLDRDTEKNKIRGEENAFQRPLLVKYKEAVDG